MCVIGIQDGLWGKGGGEGRRGGKSKAREEQKRELIMNDKGIRLGVK